MNKKTKQLLIFIITLGIMLDAYQSITLKKSLSNSMTASLQSVSGYANLTDNDMNLSSLSAKLSEVDKIKETKPLNAEDMKNNPQMQQFVQYFQIYEKVLTLFILLFLLFDLYAYFRLFRLKNWARKYFVFFYGSMVLFFIVDFFVILNFSFSRSFINKNIFIWVGLLAFYSFGFFFLGSKKIRTYFITNK